MFNSNNISQSRSDQLVLQKAKPSFVYIRQQRSKTV